MKNRIKSNKEETQIDQITNYTPISLIDHIIRFPPKPVESRSRFLILIHDNFMSWIIVDANLRGEIGDSISQIAFGSINTELANN